MIDAVLHIAVNAARASHQQQQQQQRQQRGRVGLLAAGRGRGRHALHAAGGGRADVALALQQQQEGLDGVGADAEAVMQEEGVVGEQDDAFWDAEADAFAFAEEQQQQGLQVAPPEAADEDFFDAQEDWGVWEDGEPGGAADDDGAEWDRNARNFRERLDHEVWPGAGHTLRQFLWRWCDWKLRHDCTDTGFEELMAGLFAQLTKEAGFSDEQCLVPQSVYMIRRILGVKQLSELEWHPCICHKHAWEPLPQAKWFAEGDERATGPTYVCPVCNAHRFHRVKQLNETTEKIEPKLVG